MAKAVEIPVREPIAPPLRVPNAAVRLGRLTLRKPLGAIGALIVVTARHVMGLRAAAFLTAGIVRLPFWQFVVADGLAMLVGVSLTFALAYLFTDHITALLADVHRVERWLGLLGLLGLSAWAGALGRSSWSRIQLKATLDNPFATAL